MRCDEARRCPVTGWNTHPQPPVAIDLVWVAQHDALNERGALLTPYLLQDAALEYPCFDFEP